MIGKISGTGSYVPSRYLDNHNLSQIVDTSDEWIQERTGIIRRHIVEADTTVSMAAQAAEKALESAKMLPEEIDLLIVSTISSNVILPCTACEVQKQIHAVHATCFDLNAACTGFLFAYNTAQAYIASGMYKNVLVIGAESLSSLVDWKDRSTCILFGDGAGAVVLRAEEGESYIEPRGLERQKHLYLVWRWSGGSGTQGRRGRVIPYGDTFRWEQGRSADVRHRLVYENGWAGGL